jgi:nucleoside-diphosphate-sugar epimerase
MGISTYDSVAAIDALASRTGTMRALVTGGSGFIGGHLGSALAHEGHAVRTFDLAQPQTRLDGADLLVGDLLDVNRLTSALRGIDTVFHLAAKHRFFGVSPDEFRRVNVEGTRNLLEAASRTGTSRFVFYSSVAVYGDSPATTTEETICRPVGPYGETKLAAERLVSEWALQDSRREVLIVRPTVVFGSGNKGNIYRLIRQIDGGWFVPIGAGTNVKSVAYVENLVAATMFLVNRMTPGVSVYNYADDPHLTFREIATLIHDALGRRMPRWSLPVQPMLSLAKPIEVVTRAIGRDLPVRAAILKINKTTHHSAEKIRQAGFAPVSTIEAGLKQMVKWYQMSKKEQE